MRSVLRIIGVRRVGSVARSWRSERSVVARAATIAIGFAATFVAFGGGVVCAQANGPAEPQPLQGADTSSPRATLKTFIEACDEVYRRARTEGRSYRGEAERRMVTARILRCLDLNQVPSSVQISVGREAAVCLKEVLDRIELPAEDSWPDSSLVAESEITKWTIPQTEITIAKVKEGPREGEFLFSPETVERAADFYAIVEDLPYHERDKVTPGFYRFFLSEPGWLLPRSWIRVLPSWAHARSFGQAVWQWVALLLTLILGFTLMGAIYVFGRWRARVVRSDVVRYLMTLAFPVAAMLVPLGTLYFVAEHIRISGTVLLVIAYSLRVIFLLALMVVLLGAGNRIAALVIATPWFDPHGLDAQLVRLICRVFSIVAAVIVFLEGGQQFGIPLTTLVAGAGVGGLAVALAAQDTLKNVFGSIMITLDSPYRVGERIVAKGYDGFVEQIGLRSTKIRLLTGHQVSIPNDDMARSDIENIGRRPYIRRRATIQMPSTTPVAKVRRALQIVRGVLEHHEGMSEDYPPRIYLQDINDSSIGISVIYWYHPPDYWDYLAFSERVNLQVMEQFEAEQIPFARPALTVRMTDERGGVA